MKPEQFPSTVTETKFFTECKPPEWAQSMADSHVEADNRRYVFAMSETTAKERLLTTARLLGEVTGERNKARDKITELRNRLLKISQFIESEIEEIDKT